MAEKTSQTMPLDWGNIRTKCPCCGASMKLVMTWKSEGLQFDLMPAPDAEGNMDDVMHSANNSLMNIVSVSEHRSNDQESGDKTDHHDDNRRTSACGHSVSADQPESQSSSSNSSTNDFQMQNFVGATLCQPLLHSPSDADQHLQTMSVTVNREPEVTHTLTSVAAKADPSLRLIVKANTPSVTHIVGQLHGHLQPKFRCGFVGCGIVFDDMQQLELHYKLHKGEKIQKCEWPSCGRLFSSKEKLRNHVRCRHTGERPFKCPAQFCTKAFTSQKHLKDHSLLHTDERPFDCDWDGCNRKFRRRHHLVAHIRVHTKERPFTCNFPGCDMRFTKAHHVKRHFETHVKYRPAIMTPASNQRSVSSTTTTAASTAGITLPAT